jgi:predicted nucleic acid-binding protein
VAVYYFDTSALVKRYLQEDGTTWVRGITDPVLVQEIYIVRVTGPEMVAAFFLKARRGEITDSEAAAASVKFEFDFKNQYRIVEVTVTVAERAMRLARQHSLRGYDSVQLAAALELRIRRNREGSQPFTFISADNRLNASAQTEGLGTDNPNLH